MPDGSEPVTKNIRLAVPGDREAIMALMVRLHAEEGMAEFDEEKTYAGIDECLVKGQGICVVAVQEDIVVGSVGLFFGSFWYSKQVQLFQRWFFVHPQYRKSQHARRLLEFCQTVRRKMETDVFIDIRSTNDTERKVAFFARFAKPIGQFFMLGGE